MVIGWERLHQDARALAAALLDRLPIQGLVAVTRGGLVPAAILARELGCRVIETVGIAMYDETAPGDPAMLKHPAAAGDGAGWIIVDDLVDSGTTARLVRAMLPRAHYACLYAKPAGRAFADSWVAEVPQDTWVHFPWDTAALHVPPLAGRNPA